MAAASKKKVIVALKTDDVELHEVDISHLQPGDAETIYTEDGKTIDLLRTGDDVEIYIDGEQLDLGAAGTDAHGAHHAGVHKKIEINCDDAEACEDLVWVGEDEGADPAELHQSEKVYIIKKEVIAN